jgi:hypothetical protein
VPPPGQLDPSLTFSFIRSDAGIAQTQGVGPRSNGLLLEVQEIARKYLDRCDPSRIPCTSLWRIAFTLNPAVEVKIPKRSSAYDAARADRRTGSGRRAGMDCYVRLAIGE